MKTLKYAVVLFLVVMALGMAASGPGVGLNDKTLAIAGSLGQPGINALALITPNPVNHDKCLQSCAASFPDKYSFQYRACVKGC